MRTAELVEAIRKGDRAAVKALLDEDPSLLTAKSGNVSAILLALYHGQPEIARLFAEGGAPVTFSEACALGDRSRVEQLLRNDPSLASSYSEDGFPALGLAIFFRQPEIARLLIERGADVNAAARNPQQVAPVHAAAAVSDRDSMRILLQRGANPNARQQQGVTALHGVASRGDIEMAKMLIDAGADAGAKSDDGKDAADYATERAHPDFVAWFRSR